MIFKIKSYYDDKFDNKLVTAPVIISARRIIILSKLGADDILLSRYLMSKYKKGLKQLCLYLIKRAKIMKNFNKELIVVFPTKADETLARLITYGNGVIPGSKLLRIALS